MSSSSLLRFRFRRSIEKPKTRERSADFLHHASHRFLIIIINVFSLSPNMSSLNATRSLQRLCRNINVAKHFSAFSSSLQGPARFNITEQSRMGMAKSIGTKAIPTPKLTTRSFSSTAEISDKVKSIIESNKVRFFVTLACVVGLSKSLTFSLPSFNNRSLFSPSRIAHTARRQRDYLTGWELILRS